MAPPTAADTDLPGPAVEATDQISYRHLVESIRDYAIFLLDRTGHVRSWNIGAERLKGYRPHEILGQHFSRFYPPEQVAMGRPDLLLETAALEGRVEDEGWRVRKDGTRFWADVVITALRDERGELTGFAKVTRDLTDRRHTVESIRQSEERYRLLVEGVQDYAILMLDPRGFIRSWSTGAQRLKGYTADEVVGQHFRMFYPPEDAEAGKPERELAEAIANGRAEDEGWRVRKDGTRFWANVVVTALFDEAGGLRGFAKVTRDLTERLAAEQERIHLIEQRKRLERLEETDRFKTHLINAAAHELNTPLTPILLQLQLLRGGELGPRERASLAVVERNVVRLQDLVGDLLNVSRLETGRVALRPQEVEVQALLRETVETFRESARREGVSLEQAPGPPLEAYADPSRVVQVLMNLVTNALRYTPPGGRVALAAARQGDEVVVRVTDTGVGIAPHQQTKLFQPFSQLDNVPPDGRDRGGSGLGLYIAKGLVDAMGGRIWAESEGPGRGSSFAFTLPLANGPSESAGAPQG